MSSPTTEPEKMEAGSSDISRIDIYDLLELFVTLLIEQAIRHLGLRVDPRTNETRIDAARAHLAIDCIISLVDKMEPNLPSEEKDRLRNVITELQLKYVQQTR